MLTLSLTFVGLAAVIVAAAMFLAKFGDEIAERTGLGGSVTGLVLLAGATSLPELSVGYSAIAIGADDITAGGILGSSLVNLLILALVDLISRKPGQILTRSAVDHALSATVGALLTGLILLGILLDNQWTQFCVGPCSWAVIIAYALCARLIYLDEKEGTESESSEEAENSPDIKIILLNFAGFITATVVIFFVAPMVASCADEIATTTGLGRTFIGTLLVAVVTSLPEAVSTIAAVRMGAVDMAIGNIFGSNAFNMVILASLDFATETSLLSAIAETHAITGTCVLLTTAVGLMCILYQPKKRWWLFEPDALLIAFMVIGALYLVYVYGQAAPGAVVPGLP
jgi:cation:H+ antiporter